MLASKPKRVAKIIGGNAAGVILVPPTGTKMGMVLALAPKHRSIRCDVAGQIWTHAVINLHFEPGQIRLIELISLPRIRTPYSKRLPSRLQR